MAKNLFVFSGNAKQNITEDQFQRLMAQWSLKNKTDNMFNHRFDLYEYVNTAILKDQSIDFLEFGVYKGVSLFKWVDIHQNKDSLFYGFLTPRNIFDVVRVKTPTHQLNRRS